MRILRRFVPALALLIAVSALAAGRLQAAAVRSPRDSPTFPHGRGPVAGARTPATAATPPASLPRVPTEHPLVPDPGNRPLWVPGTYRSDGAHSVWVPGHWVW